jgi:hypothetical protein
MNDLCDGFLATGQNKRLAPSFCSALRYDAKQQAGFYLTPSSAALRWAVIQVSICAGTTSATLEDACKLEDDEATGRSASRCICRLHILKIQKN